MRAPEPSLRLIQILRESGSREPGGISRVKAIARPSGDHLGSYAPSLSLRKRRRLPSGAIV
jgi:hypothetical protein